VPPGRNDASHSFRAHRGRDLRIHRKPSGREQQIGAVDRRRLDGDNDIIDSRLAVRSVLQ